MPRERILRAVGFDPDVLETLSSDDRGRLRALAAAWLAVCFTLGAVAGYAGWLVKPSPALVFFAATSVTLLTINLLRVVHAGGGMRVRANDEHTVAAARHYRPSLTPTVIFCALAALLSQPAQLPFWPDLAPAVEQHRLVLIEQHDVAARRLGIDPAPYRAELEEAEFPIFRLRRMWQRPKRASKWTGLFCLLVLLPSLWGQFFAIASIRRYERARGKRVLAARASLATERDNERRRLLERWQTFATQRGEA